MSIETIHKKVCSSKILTDITKAYRSASDKEEKKRWKRSMIPSAEFNSVCRGTRKIDNVRKMTGFVVIDIDRLKSASQAESLRDNLFNDTRLGCVLAFVSVSGLGVKAVLNVGDGVTSENIKEWYKAVGYYLKSTYGICIDANAIDPVRLCYLSHDKDAKFAPDRVCSVDVAWATLPDKREETPDEGVGGKPAGRTFVYKFDEGQLHGLLKSFAELCTRHNLSYLDEYNTWIGFGANCRRVFNGSSEGMEVWDACSRTSPKYNRRDLVEKWGQLPEGDGEITVLGMLFNFAKRWSDEINLQSWLHIQMSKLGMFSTIVVYSDECGKSQGLFDGSEKEADAPATPKAHAFGLGDGSEQERDNPQTEEKLETDVGRKLELLEKALGLCLDEFSVDSFQANLCRVSGKAVTKSTALKGVRALIRKGRIFNSGKNQGMYVKDCSERDCASDCGAFWDTPSTDSEPDRDGCGEPVGKNGHLSDTVEEQLVDALNLCPDVFSAGLFQDTLIRVSGHGDLCNVIGYLDSLCEKGLVSPSGFDEGKYVKTSRESDASEQRHPKVRFNQEQYDEWNRRALDMCDDVFIKGEFKDAYCYVRGISLSDASIRGQLAKLEREGLVLHDVYRKKYIKTITGKSAGEPPATDSGYKEVKTACHKTVDSKTMRDCSLNLCDDCFTLKDYRKAMSKVRGRHAQDNHARYHLNILLGDGRITERNGVFHKIRP